MLVLSRHRCLQTYKKIHLSFLNGKQALASRVLKANHDFISFSNPWSQFCLSTHSLLDGYLQKLILEPSTLHQKDYFDCWIDKLNPTARGHRIESFCRSIYTTHLCPDSPEPQSVTDEYCANGSRRGFNSTSCDFMSGDKRVEVKATGLKFRGGVWKFQWSGVKRTCFDQLILCGYTPSELLFWDWNSTSSLHRSATSVLGVKIQVAASIYSQCLEDALQEILGKLQWPLLHRMPLDEFPKQLPQPPIPFICGPLYHLSPPKRGQVLQQLTRVIYSSILYPGSAEPVDPPDEFSLAGGKLGPNLRSFDFASGGVRVEVKSAQLQYVKSRSLWRLQWHCVKIDKFDRLILVAHTPHQLLFWEWDGHSGLSSTGIGTADRGYMIQAYALKRQDWKEAVQHITEAFPARLLFSTMAPPLDMSRADPIDCCWSPLRK